VASEAVELGEEVRQQRRGPGLPGHVAVAGRVLHDPATLPADASATDVEDLDGSLQVVAGGGDDVGVGVVGEDHGLLLHGGVHRSELVSQGRCAFKIEILRGAFHLVTDIAHDPLGVATGEEGAEAVDEFHVLRGRDPPHARGGAPVNVPEQTGPTQLLVASVHPCGAGPHREDAGE